MHREVADTSGDIGSDPDTLAAEFPDFQFELTNKWWQTDDVDGVHDESKASVSRRILEFSAFLLRRKVCAASVFHHSLLLSSSLLELRVQEFRIVIIGHSGFFKQWTLQSKLKNLEFKTFELCAD